MFHSIADFLKLWEEEAKNTEKLFLALSDNVLDKELVPGLRTLKQMAWHIIETPQEMLKQTGLKLAGDSQVDISKLKAKDLIEMHHKVIASIAHQIQTHWHNKDLHHADNINGEEWPRSKTLSSLVFHLIHHRGQMSVLMHIAGLKVPGLYGLVNED